MNNKERGSSYERLTAKELSIWLFGKKNLNLLRRHPDSGGFKGNYCGDICPAGQLPKDWDFFPFLIECKYGYEGKEPTIWARTQAIRWYLKALKESLKHNQYIIFIINNYTNRKFNTITTNKYLNPNLILHEISFPVIVNNKIHHLFVYNYKTVLSLDYVKLFSEEAIIEGQ